MKNPFAPSPSRPLTSSRYMSNWWKYTMANHQYAGNSCCYLYLKSAAYLWKTKDAYGRRFLLPPYQTSREPPSRAQKECESYARSRFDRRAAVHRAKMAPLAFG